MNPEIVSASCSFIVAVLWFKRLELTSRMLLPETSALRSSVGLSLGILFVYRLGTLDD